jgi:hypothetical protein
MATGSVIPIYNNKGNAIIGYKASVGPDLPRSEPIKAPMASSIQNQLFTLRKKQFYEY